MNSKSKLFFATVLSTILILSSVPAYANYNAPDINQVKVTITNNETGESSVSYEDINIVSSQLRSFGVNKEITKECEVFIPIKLNDSGITLNSVESHDKEDGVIAKLSVSYLVNSTNEKVKVKSFSGSWDPGSIFIVSDRLAGVTAGLGSGLTMEKYPTKNTFSYTTGWDYAYRIWGDASPRVWSEATTKVVDMEGSNTIKVEFPFS